MSDKTIHVCYCGNKKIFHGLLLSALSLAIRTKRPLHLYILSMDLHEQDSAYLPFSQNQMDILNGVLREFNTDSCAEQRDLRDLYLKMQKHNKNAHNMYTPYAQLRLYLTELENIPDKILYLDVDTMCMKDVGELYDIDISGYEYLDRQTLLQFRRSAAESAQDPRNAPFRTRSAACLRKMDVDARSVRTP